MLVLHLRKLINVGIFWSVLLDGAKLGGR